MGDPRKHRRKFTRPSHPWQATRIEDERKVKDEFGLKNKKELWKSESMMRRFKAQAKKLISRTDAQSQKEGKLLLKKLYNLGLIEEDAKFDTVLDLDTRSLLQRRLQTVVFKQGLAHSIKQARQFITHKHIQVEGIQVTVPSYLVLRTEEKNITFSTHSEIANPEHPERAVRTKPAPAPKAAVEQETTA